MAVMNKRRIMAAMNRRDVMAAMNKREMMAANNWGGRIMAALNLKEDILQLE